MPKLSRFATYAWGVLVYTMGVILWGAFVRATGAGAGCGNHWPQCNGQIIPRATEIETLIEFSHRVTSGISGFLVLGLVIWAWRIYPRRHHVRLAAWTTLFFIVLEAAVGAGQVRFELVADNASPARAVIGSIHLVNTFFLIGAMLLTAWWASGGRPIHLRGQGMLGGLFGLGFLAMLFLGASGAVTALGDTLFPVDSLAAGIQQDLDPNAHFLIQLRVFHPLIAVATGVLLLTVAFLADRQRPQQGIRPFAWALTGLFGVQLAVGALNVVLLAPVWMQLVHLLLADLVWMAFVLAAAMTFASQPVRATVEQPARTEVQAV